MIDPHRIVVAGDWHGDASWAAGVIGLLPDLLPYQPRILLHTGDFGIWPGRPGRHFLEAVEQALIDADAQLWFVDGNHEDHRLLGIVKERALPGCRIALYGGSATDARIWWLPRGYRWTWHARTWLALGGATSVDRIVRKEGLNWWPQETLSDSDIDAACTPGPVDVMVTHDCPTSVPLHLPNPPAWWDIAPAIEHRKRLQFVVDTVQPGWLMHGHYHLSHQTLVPSGRGAVQVTGLDQNGAITGNYRVLDVHTMEWDP